MTNWIKTLQNKQFKVYSQYGQDGIIEEIFKNIGTINSPPFCIEFGFNSTELTEADPNSKYILSTDSLKEIEKYNTVNYCTPNTANLILNKNWNSLLLDGGNENPKINLYKHVLYPDNIIDIFKKYQVPINPEFISIDVDSIDLWLFQAILQSEFNPMVISVEYNSHFPLDFAITFPNNKIDRWDGIRGYGASLKALYMMGKKYGYHLIGIVMQNDLFFIRGDLIDESHVPPLEYWRKYTNTIHHLPSKMTDTIKKFFDYEEYLKTRDLKKSQEKALPIVLKYLCSPLKVAEDSCYDCGKSGHFSRNCPLK